MTDAYVAMGLLQPDLFLGGEMALDRDAALQALGRVAERLQMDPVELAQGAYHITNTKLAAAVAAMTTHRGLDPREFSLFAYGAAGPMHGVAVARELGITEVVVPYFPGGFSAFGMIASRSRVEYSQATMASFAQLGPDEFNRVLDELEVKCRAGPGGPGHRPERDHDRARVLRDVHRTGAGQPPAAARRARSTQRRSSGCRRSSTRSTTGASATALRRSRSSSPRCRSSGSDRVRRSSCRGEEGEDVAPERNPERAVISRSELHIDGGSHADSAFYDRAKLVEGDEVEGPAVIDDRLGTIVINTGAVARVAHHGTLRIEV